MQQMDKNRAKQYKKALMFDSPTSSQKNGATKYVSIQVAVSWIDYKPLWEDGCVWSA